MALVKAHERSNESGNASRLRRHPRALDATLDPKNERPRAAINFGGPKGTGLIDIPGKFDPVYMVQQGLMMGPIGAPKVPGLSRVSKGLNLAAGAGKLAAPPRSALSVADVPASRAAWAGGSAGPLQLSRTSSGAPTLPNLGERLMRARKPSDSVPLISKDVRDAGQLAQREAPLKGTAASQHHWIAPHEPHNGNSIDDFLKPQLGDKSEIGSAGANDGSLNGKSSVDAAGLHENVSTQPRPGPVALADARIRLAAGAAENPISISMDGKNWVEARNTYSLGADSRFHTFDGGQLVYDTGNKHVPGVLKPLDEFSSHSNPAKIYRDPRVDGQAQYLSVLNDGSLRSYDRANREWHDIAPTVSHFQPDAGEAAKGRQPIPRDSGLKGGAPPVRLPDGRILLETPEPPVRDNDPRLEEAIRKYVTEENSDDMFDLAYNHPVQIYEEYGRKDMFKSLPFDTYYALRRYQNGSTVLNTNLALNNSSPMTGFHASDLDKAILKGQELGYGHGNEEVYRGAQVPPDFHGKLQEKDGTKARSPAVGVTYKPDHFLSTSTDQEVAKGFLQGGFPLENDEPHFLKIDPEGGAAVNISDMLGDQFGSQKEVLFPRDSKFVVSSLAADSQMVPDRHVPIVEMYQQPPKRVSAEVGGPDRKRARFEGLAGDPVAHHGAASSSGLVPSGTPRDFEEWRPLEGTSHAAATPSDPAPSSAISDLPEHPKFSESLTDDLPPSDDTFWGWFDNFLERESALSASGSSMPPDRAAPVPDTGHSSPADIFFDHGDERADFISWENIFDL